MSKIEGHSGQTHIGNVRKENEDRFLVERWPDTRASLAVIADGMGSYGGGAHAAEIVIDTFAQLLHQQLPAARCDRYEMLLGAFYEADSRIRSLQNSTHPEMGATVVASIATDDELLHLHAGDCRIFHITNQGLAYVSHDHSVVQTLIDTGMIDQHQAGLHPMRSIVTSCLGGPRSNLRISIDPLLGDMDQHNDGDHGPFRTLRSGDVIIMCSDGLWSEVDCDNMLRALHNTRDPETVPGTLIEMALAGAAPDNISVVVLDVDRFRMADL